MYTHVSSSHVPHTHTTQKHSSTHTHRHTHMHTHIYIHTLHRHTHRLTTHNTHTTHRHTPRPKLTHYIKYTHTQTSGRLFPLIAPFILCRSPFFSPSPSPASTFSYHRLYSFSTEELLVAASTDFFALSSICV